MKNIPTLPEGCRTYTVDFNSTLGISIKNYIDRCSNAQNAINIFLEKELSDFDFPVHVTDETEYILSDDCDAGGLIGIIVPADVIHEMSDRAIVMWDAMPCYDDDKSVILFPRIEAQTHYMHYSEAVKIFNSKSKQWEFMPPSQKDKANKRPIRSVTYDEVRHLVNKADADELKKKCKTLLPSTPLAIAKYFSLPADSDHEVMKQRIVSLKDRNILSKYMSDAISLYKCMTELPSVSSNSLARMLQLSGMDVKHPYCEYRTDSEKSQFVIITNLTSSLSEMREITQP